MKKILSYVLIFLLIFPMFISASVYEDAVSIKNSYITKYSDYDKYFTSETGEFLSINEYNLTKYGAYSYLVTGTAYWLKDSCGSNKYYVLSDSLKCENKNTNTNVGIKIMYKTKSDVNVIGSGSQSDPWKFIETYKLYIDSSDIATGTVEPSGLKYANTNGTYTYNYTEQAGYEYSNVKCKGTTPSVDKNSYTITFTNISSDTSCAVVFKSKDLKVSLNHNGGEGTSLLNEIYYKYNTAWYSDSSITNKITKIDSLPTKNGYTFDGYYSKDGSGNLNKQIIDSEGNITTEHKLFSSDITIYAKWTAISKPVRIYYNMFGGDYKGTSNLTYSESYIACNSSTQSVIDSYEYSSGCDSSNNYYYDMVKEGGTINLSDYNDSSWIKITNKSTKHVTSGREWWFYPQNDSSNDWDVLSQSTDYSYNELKGYAEDMGDHYKLIVYTNWYTTYYCYFNKGYSYVTLWNYSNSNTKSVMVYDGTYGLNGIYIEKTYSNGWRYIGCHSELSSYRWSYFMDPENFTSCVVETRCYRSSG